MVRSKRKVEAEPESVFKSDKYDWCPPGFFALKFTDIVARVAIQDYANLIAVRDPALSKRLTEAVDAVGGWGTSELAAACRPLDASPSDHICINEGCEPHDHGNANASTGSACQPAVFKDCARFMKKHSQPVNGAMGKGSV